MWFHLGPEEYFVKSYLYWNCVIVEEADSLSNDLDTLHRVNGSLIIHIITKFIFKNTYKKRNLGDLPKYI